MKALVGAFKQPGEGPSRGLLRDCTTSPINRFAELFTTEETVELRYLIPYAGNNFGNKDSEEATLYATLYATL